MEEAAVLGNYLPLSFKTPKEQEYIEFLWNAFETNHAHGKYQFAFLAYHMLTMSFVYFNIWQIKKAHPGDFEKGLIGFGNDVEKTLLAAERILNKAEYEAAYGSGGNIHFDLPLPKILKRLFSSYSFLFLGCSLSADRTIQTFMKVAQLEGSENLPHHYALLACPANPENKSRIEGRLANAHITPLWYPDGEHQHVEQILELLLD